MGLKISRNLSFVRSSKTSVLRRNFTGCRFFKKKFACLECSRFFQYFAVFLWALLNIFGFAPSPPPPSLPIELCSPLFEHGNYGTFLDQFFVSTTGDHGDGVGLVRAADRGWHGLFGGPRLCPSGLGRSELHVGRATIREKIE